VIPIEASWRLRPAFRVLLLAAIVVPSALAVLVANAHRKWDYNAISNEFEEPELPPQFDGDMLGSNSVRTDGMSQVEWADGWVYFGPQQDGKDSGVWTILDPEGHERGHFNMREGNRDGPCELWDATGRRRVTGSYRKWNRVGLWTLDNVLGEGRRYVMYTPAWTVGDWP
jgi:hypothetical protein